MMIKKVFINTRFIHKFCVFIIAIAVALTSSCGLTPLSSQMESNDQIVSFSLSGEFSKGVTNNSVKQSLNSASATNIPFKTGGVIYGINQVAVTVPYGTNVTNLVASFNTLGGGVTVNGVSQTSGVTPNDFTSPVTYTVTAADGATSQYVVAVNVASITSKEITQFSIGNYTGVINLQNISVTVPYGTNLTNLIASFTTSGQSVTVGSTSQVSGTTPNNFTSPVTYTVTAADGSTQNYVVTVTISPI